ncbi:MAG: peptidoglycan DD-metalloendopeptidase family protein [Panacagrimonas sp.]
MDIIVVTRDRSRTWRFALTPGNPFLWAPIIMAAVGVIALSTSIGWAVRGGSDVLAAEGIADLWSQQISDQRAELVRAKAEADENTRALSQKVAQLQAHVLRLDAAGGRMTEIAGLDPGEFNFTQPPAVGGPELPEVAQHFDGDPVLSALEAFEQKLDDRERQMRVLEDILMAGRLHREMKPSGLPVLNGYVSSAYGFRADPFNGRRTMHQGIDFAASPGSNVLAVAAGIVTETSRRSGYGLMVEINHGNGYVTRYGHNQRSFVKPGQKVDKGQKIASVGSSGRSTGPHVHFEVLLNGYVVNPAQYIRAAQ